MTTIEFTVYAVPVAQPRQSQRVVRTKDGRVFATNYMQRDAPVQEYKYAIKRTARQWMNNEPLWEGPLGMDLDVFLPRPKRLDGKKMPGCQIWHSGKKDVDNLFKSVADALTGIVYRDDGQVCNARVRKFYHERTGIPRVFIKIFKME